jgi:superoxide dismutase, Fe-Mn family
MNAQAARRQAEVHAHDGHVTLPKLPYGYAGLEPYISSRTMEFHHDKHHKTYVEKTNELIAGTRYANMTLEQIVRESAKTPADSQIFNNAGQAWNHDFYWHSLHPGGLAPGGELVDMIKSEFGSFEGFKKTLVKAAMGQFGSGWVWLVFSENRLAIRTTGNAQTPMTTGARCLVTLDVWEHAYYLDYQNRRADHIAAVADKLINWEFALQNLKRAPTT